MHLLASIVLLIGLQAQFLYKLQDVCLGAEGKKKEEEKSFKMLIKFSPVSKVFTHTKNGKISLWVSLNNQKEAWSAHEMLNYLWIKVSSKWSWSAHFTGSSSSSVANCLSFARECEKKKILLCRFDQCLCRDEHKLPIENSQNSLNCTETIRRRAAGSQDYLTTEGRFQLFVKYLEQNTEKRDKEGKTEVSKNKLSLTLWKDSDITVLWWTGCQRNTREVLSMINTIKLL